MQTETAPRQNEGTERAAEPAARAAVCAIISDIRASSLIFEIR